MVRAHSLVVLVRILSAIFFFFLEMRILTGLGYMIDMLTPRFTNAILYSSDLILFVWLLCNSLKRMSIFIIVVVVIVAVFFVILIFAIFWC